MQVNGLEIDVTYEQLLYDLRDSLTNSGIFLLADIRPVGNNIMISCPSHKEGQERKASCGVSISDVYKGEKLIPEGTVHCFTCGYTASLTEFISYCFGVTDGGILGNKWIKANYRVGLTSKNRNCTLKFNRNKNTHEHYSDVPQEVLERYRYTVDYLYDRGLTDEIIEQFDIGYNRDEDCITIPVTDIYGHVKWIQTRSIERKFYYIPSGIIKTDFLLGASEILRLNRQREKVFIVESPFNMLTLWKLGYCAICLFGTGGGQQYKLLRKLPIRHYVLALDPDEAGREGMRKLFEELRNYKIISEVEYKEGDSRDINDLDKDFMDLPIFLKNF